MSEYSSDGDDVEREVFAPTTVHYCPVSTLPYEYIEFAPKSVQKACIKAINSSLAELADKGIDVNALGLTLTKEGGDDKTEESKSQKRGGKGANIKSKQLERKVLADGAEGPVQQVTVAQAQLNKKKKKTIVCGLETCGHTDLKKAAKTFAASFACASSVSNEATKTKPSEIMIQYQGDIDCVIDLLKSKFKIDEKVITNLGEIKNPGIKNDEEDGEEASTSGPGGKKGGGGKKKGGGKKRK